ncbi:MAG: four helix bundle suffix domain-containing protein [Kiritimatiellae bacterium]|nr:four helix bundle suffix domain-containing protein [Kiritimatiellia bacterium]
MAQLFDKAGGYRKLNSFHFATLVHLATIRFCKRFVPYQEDPLGKTSGQMVGAARSGRQNIIEGSERAATSKETEMKLTDVARASLGELLGDLEIFLADRGVIPWSVHSSEHQAVSALNFPAFVYTGDALHDYWTWFHREKQRFDPWLENADPAVAANALIVLIRRAMAMLGGQMRSQGAAFTEGGGFRERLTQTRVAARDTREEAAPDCPLCGQPMRRRTARKGPHAGEAFWSCSGYPECKGTRPM